MNRRSVLTGATAIITAGLGGCLDSDEPDEEPDQSRLEVTVQNNHDRPYDVRVTVEDADAAVVFDTSFTLPPGEGRGIADDYADGEYVVAVELGERSRGQGFWNTELCDVHRTRTTIGPDGRVTHDVACEGA